MSQPLLLVVGYVWPEPNSSAAGSRILQLMQVFLRNGWRAVFASAAALSEHRFDLSSIDVAEKSIALNDSSFDEWIKKINPQAVLFDRFFTEEQFGWRVEKHCPNALRLLDTEDLHSLRHVRHQILKTAQKKCSGDAAKHALPPVQATPAELRELMAQDDMAQREIAAIFRCDLSIMISEFEIDLLKNHFAVPAQLLCYVPLLDNFSDKVAAQSLPSFAERHQFISIGNFRHEPNWDAVLYLKYGIWPLIRHYLPQAELFIYGAYPPPKATQLHKPQEGFYVKGWAMNAQEVMRSARVCLAPLRFGAGIKGKLMDAMRAGTPSVTTAIGAEAMHGNLPWGGVITNTAEDFARAAVELYQQESAWHQAQDQSFTILKSVFHQQDFAQALYARVVDLEKNLTQERSQNFIGTMLRHHSLKSTQYMSQWIEAKNKLPQ